MATQQNKSGLFSKVAKFVRNPNVHWGDLDKLAPEPQGVPEPQLEQNRQSLKDMIERKRHEDAVRKREFDQLRKLLREAPLGRPDTSAKSSFLGAVSINSDFDDRALTIRKIDEIEVQMSRQWWKGNKQPSAEVALSSSPPAPDAGPESLFAATQMTGPMHTADDVATLIGQETTAQLWSGSRAETQPVYAEILLPPVDIKAMEPPEVFKPEMGDNFSDPDLEEAAVLFANADDAGAESVLLAALRAQSALTMVVQAQAQALFDLYRSLGQQADFEREALRYAQQFGCATPVWLPSSAAPNGLPADLASATAWHCPEQLDLSALAQLPAHLPSDHGLSLNWSNLQSITASAAQDLAILVASWSEQEGSLYFEHVGVLAQVLRQATPRGMRQTAPFWWSLRMDLLRILQAQDEFDVAALEYCLTYEAAPEPWHPAKCALQTSGSDAPESSMPPAQAAAAKPQYLELAGDLQGDAANALPALDDVKSPAQTLRISCSKLIRVDFSAAGSILNWVARAQALGCQIEFRDVPFLVAAFFNLIGINQHAQVLTRTH